VVFLNIRPDGPPRNRKPVAAPAVATENQANEAVLQRSEGNFRYHTAMGKRLWICEARGYQQGFVGFLHISGRARGIGKGNSKEDACRNAKRDATQKAPPGTYARHLECRCHK
jgi:hypothetical protein